MDDIPAGWVLDLLNRRAHLGAPAYYDCELFNTAHGASVKGHAADPAAALAHAVERANRVDAVLSGQEEMRV